ncbi:Uncharacterized conserved protein UCP016134 [mine drainage metagenome]|uniref:Uncharacterized conserved protein UCP016134 n=2 Tax=mine drainage metagenome TaxID=410659 RepID=T1A8G5_9ZZZZ
MIHEMHLFEEPFNLIRGGKKTIEIRLYDEKRRKISVGDTIVFSELPDNKNEVRCRVVGLSIFGSFRDLFLAFDKSKFGHPESISVDGQVERMRSIYSSDDEKAYGVVGIHIEKLD